ncbi:hypothetical protein ACFQQB_14320 [Nonomuraea rubra]
MLFTADRPHRYANRGEVELRFVMVVAEPREPHDSRYPLDSQESRDQ